MRLREEGILMIDLTGKSVFVKTQEEYERGEVDGEINS